MASRTPPRFVPTLTEVVQAGAAQPASPLPADDLSERVLQRVELTLDRRLREALSTLILEQTNAMAPLLRERLEAVVCEVVAEAVAETKQDRRLP